MKILLDCKFYGFNFTKIQELGDILPSFRLFVYLCKHKLMFRIFVFILLTAALQTTNASRISRIMDEGEKLIKTGDYKAAAECYSRLLAFYHAGDRDTSLCRGLMYGGNCLNFSGRYVKALQFYIYAIELAEQQGNINIYESSLCNAGTIFAIFKDYERAIFYFSKAYASSVDNGHASVMVASCDNLVKAYARLGNMKEAKRYQSAFLRIADLDDPHYQYEDMLFKGIIAKADNDINTAKMYFGKALKTATANHLGGEMLAEIYNELGQTSMTEGDSRKAVSLFRQAAVTAGGGSNPEQLYDAYHYLSRAYMGLGMADSAARYQMLHTALADSVFNRKQFNKVKDYLFAYENRITDERMDKLRMTVTWLAAGIAFAVIILIIISHYNRRLHAAHRLLVEKNKELIRQNDESMRQMLARTAATADNNATGNAQKPSTLSGEKLDSLTSDITMVMNDVNIISNPDFNLNMLARMVNSNTKYVSSAINETYGKNFKAFLNGYRIREACRRLVDDAYTNLTISAIAESVGFTSANGFVTAFKRVVGVTPSAYKKLAKENDE